MFRIAFRYLKNREDAEDVLTESFVSVFENIHKFEIRNGKSLENWIKTIVINNALMLIRKNKRILFSDSETDLEIINYNDEDFDYENIYTAVMSLPVGYRTIFNMHAVEGYSHKEIAERLEISIQTSKSQYHRAKMKLREILKGYGYERKRI